MKELQALNNNDSNKIVLEAAQEKSANEILNFLIDITMVASNTKSTKDEPYMFNEAWNHPHDESHRV